MSGTIATLAQPHRVYRQLKLPRILPHSLRRWRHHLEHHGWPRQSPRRFYSEDRSARSESSAVKADSQNAAELGKGAMSRRLEQMSEDALTSSPRHARKVVEEAGFSPELKQQLERRIADGNLAAEHPQAASVVAMPEAANKNTREIAGAQPWAGLEKPEDTALRMLQDAHKPLRGSAGRRPIKLQPIDTRIKQTSKSSPGQRLANARDKTSIYAMGQDNSMSEKEREDMRQMLKDRFQPGARSMPATIQGLQSLASERIEDAIARGLFKNIPRGKGVNTERDYAASSPFLDTTEYFMNKIIQKQEVLPPWVEKQQEVNRTIATFRARIRSDWKRHAARMIASKGGTLEQQIRRAELNAQAEAVTNPRPVKKETVSSIDQSGNLTRVTVTQTPAEQAADAQAKITVVEESTLQPPQADASETAADLQTKTSASAADPVAQPPLPSPVPTAAPLPPPFRDADWEKTEFAYHTLALTSLNNLTRSYNLMAPELAKKPYFVLARELKNCYGDVAPLLPQEILDRARAPVARVPGAGEGHRQGGVLQRFSAHEKVRVWESRRPQYGFKEFWKDMWSKKQET